MRTLLSLSLILALAACTSLSTKERTFLGDEHTTLGARKVPGISDLNTYGKEELDEEKWWNGFYGNKTTTE